MVGFFELYTTKLILQKNLIIKMLITIALSNIELLPPTLY